MATLRRRRSLPSTANLLEELLAAQRDTLDLIERGASREEWKRLAMYLADMEQLGREVLDRLPNAAAARVRASGARLLRRG